MGINKCYLPTIESLKDQLNIMGIEKFLKYYSKYEIIIGETERFEFLKQQINTYQENIYKK